MAGVRNKTNPEAAGPNPGCIRMDSNHKTADKYSMCLFAVVSPAEGSSKHTADPQFFPAGDPFNCPGVFSKH